MDLLIKENMKLAIEASKNSDDPNTQVGAVLFHKPTGRIYGKGANKFPKIPIGIKNPFSLERDGEWINTKYPYIIHAEMNCLMDSIPSIPNPYLKFTGSEIYTTLFPCNDCAKLIVAAGIRRIYYLSDKYNGTDSNIAAKKIFDVSGVECIQVEL